jgi:hypothetical protein
MAPIAARRVRSPAARERNLGRRVPCTARSAARVLVVLVCALAAALAVVPAQADDFDRSHAAWSALLAKHVVSIDGGKASQVRYAGFAQDRAALSAYLAALSAVTPAEFERWPKADRIAFLVNAYNAFTIELILTRYPDLKSIRDLGNVVLNSPWKRRFFTLLGKPQHLDGVEHETLRKPGVYDEPRIHFAVNCASIGCPMLREEAYVGARLDAQLEEQTRRFLADRSRNRYSPERGALEVSPIFDWYRKDFESGFGGVRSREQFFARYAALLADRPEDRAAIENGTVPLRFLEYDWRLNDAPTPR